MTDRHPNDHILGMTSPMSRRDFVNGILVGSGAALLAACAPGRTKAAKAGSDAARYAPSGSAWTGYGGVGDYAWSNGNTEAVRDAAHGIRDRRYPDVSHVPVHETYDLVIIGGGFSGLSAAYEFHKRRNADQTCLLLENHPVIGGEAKQNEFDVDGQRLVAPQGSNAGLVVTSAYVDGTFGHERYNAYIDYWRELGLPERFEREALAGGAEKYNLSDSHYAAMFGLGENEFAMGYYFGDRGWVRDPVAAHFKNTPWTATAQKDMDDFVHNRRDVISGIADPDRWLDSVSYYDVLDKLGYGQEVRQYIDPVIAVANHGVCGNAISAYAAKHLRLPGTVPTNGKPQARPGIEGVSFPGGNAPILRTMLTRILPDTIPGDGSLPAVAQNSMNFAAFDRPENPVRIRLGSTAVRVQHDGEPSTAGSVLVTYVRDGQLYKVRARAVVLGCGGWVSRNIVGDLPEAYAAAYRQFRYGPILTVNVAVRHWRFFDKLGFTVARWFTGLGWHVLVRRNVVLGKNHPPLTPNSPIVLTFYTPFLHPTADPAVQGSLGRAQLLSTSYAEFERQIREQLSAMFGSAGFDARRDIAGVVLNRWGHAFIAPPPGYFFGTGSHPAPRDVIRQPHGRIIFAHSELQGTMNMGHATLEGRRGALQALEML